MVTGTGLFRGRPRAALPLHMVVSRELTAAMRQLRVANGDHTAQTVEILNQAITDLYPDATEQRTDYGRRSVPHLVSERYVLRVERGHHARLPVPPWLRSSRDLDPAVVSGSRVPPWLVRAYDMAFGADGYLVDMFDWASALLADHEHNPPRLTRHLPAHAAPGHEYDYLAAGFVDEQAPTAIDPAVQALLAEQAGQLITRGDHASGAPQWMPSSQDGSGSLGDGEEELPEGTLVPPGGQLVARWVLHNTGKVPWRDRLLYRVGATTEGIRTPPFVIVPDTDPGQTAELRCPLRAPHRSGTYRVCLKMGWPNGVYCFPSTLLGLIVTLIVPPDDLMDPAADWPTQ